MTEKPKKICTKAVQHDLRNIWFWANWNETAKDWWMGNGNGINDLACARQGESEKKWLTRPTKCIRKLTPKKLQMITIPDVVASTADDSHTMYINDSLISPPAHQHLSCNGYFPCEPGFAGSHMVFPSLVPDQNHLEKWHKFLQGGRPSCQPINSSEKNTKNSGETSSNLLK